jgi:hypothetical protein
LRQASHFYKADPEFGNRVAQGLGVDIEEVIGKAPRKPSTYFPFPGE